MPTVPHCFWCFVSVAFVSLFLIVSPAIAETSKAKERTLTSPSPNDLDAIKQRGVLRIIVPVNFAGGQFLPRTASPVNAQQQIAREFAKSLDLDVEIIPVLSINEIFSTLIEGKGDIIAANITITDQRKEKMAFSVPIEHVKEVVLVKADNQQIKKPSDLNGKSLLVNPSTSFWETATALQKQTPSLTVVPPETRLHDEDALDLIADGDYDATIRDSNIADMYLTYRDDLKIAFALKEDKAIAWAIHPEATKLKKTLDQYLNSLKLSATHYEPQFGDLDDIKKRGVLRILLKNNSSSYFFWKGELMGFEYEMAKAYAKHLGVKLAVVVPPENALMLDWLNQGKADIAAGFLTPTEEWKEQFISASLPYHEAAHHLVVQTSNHSIESRSDLQHHTVVVHKSSIYWTILEKLKSSGIDLTLEAAPESMEIEEILAKVAKGEYESTLVDQHLMDIELNSGVAVKSAFSFDKIYEHSLAVRGANKALLSSLNDYISKKKDSALYARLYRKYFDNSKSVSRMQRNRLIEKDGEKRLSAYDDFVKKYSHQYGFDWRLITAQMFSESRFRPEITSSSGAIGLMQVMTSTGRQLRLRELTDPETNIHAGVKYMHWITGKFESELPIADRMWFTLASYNAGLGHVLDARRLASKEGLDKNRWFGNVEKAMLMLSNKQHYNKARYGYVRGREPVGYVKKIKSLYENYINVVGTEGLAANNTQTETAIR